MAYTVEVNTIALLPLMHKIVNILKKKKKKVEFCYYVAIWPLIRESLSEWVGGWVSGRVSEWVSEWASERASGWVGAEWVGGWVVEQNEWVGMRMSARLNFKNGQL